MELKEDGYVGAAMDLVAARLAPDAYVVTSFARVCSRRSGAIAPETRTGLLIGPRGAGQAGAPGAGGGADFLAPHVSMARAGLLEWAARRGLAAWVWTVNDARTLRASVPTRAWRRSSPTCPPTRWPFHMLLTWPTAGSRLSTTCPITRPGA